MTAERGSGLWWGGAAGLAACPRFGSAGCAVLLRTWEALGVTVGCWPWLGQWLLVSVVPGPSGCLQGRGVLGHLGLCVCCYTEPFARL